ncbi:hypothetical protein FHG87_002629 [Trinorchestia longiramus]|nr:hypothetical protein FHG87_002629 [Trinorchestia longiramus]
MSKWLIKGTLCGRNAAPFVITHPMSSLDDDLDELAVERLILLDDLLKNKQMLAEYMKTGFFNLGKARYSLGCHAVSALRIPETSIFASTKIQSNQEISNFGVKYTSRKISKTDGTKVGSTDEHLTDCGQRRQVEELADMDAHLEELEERANKEPINWFSALPPVCLRHAQSQFESALQLAAECASLQEKLAALNNRYSSLMAQ